jgi:hypothetical protein
MSFAVETARPRSVFSGDRPSCPCLLRETVEELPHLRHAPTRTLRMLALTACVLALPVVSARAQSATPTPGPTANPAVSCAAQINSAITKYTQNVLQYFASCSLNALAQAGQCSDSAVQVFLSNAANDVLGKLNPSGGCSDDALFDICPLNAKTTDPTQLRPKIIAALTTAAGSLESELAQLNADTFSTPYDGCPRPTTTIGSSTPLYKCAQLISGQQNSGEGFASPLEQCLFSCERLRIATPSNDVCVDDITGDPIATDPTNCEAGTLAQVSGIANRCTSDAQIVALGCPLGQSTVASLETELSTRLTTIVQQLNLDIYHSDCQGNLPGQPTAPLPADVTLEPSLTHKQINCGQTLDNAFFGSDSTLSFDSDLDCSPAKTATDGIIIGKSGVTVNGRFKTWSITGPSRSSLRTGVGIRLLPGVARVQIRNMKAIQNFGVGIQDADDGSNRKLVIAKSTVRRNVVAGMRLRSPRGKIDTVTADKNGIGMDLSGDGIKVKASDIKGSLYPPMVGLQLGGVDTNGDGHIVQVTDPLNVIELNQGDGVLITQGAHNISNAQIVANLGNGVEIQALASGSLLHSNGIKNNGVGIVVDGDSNVIEYNTAEQNIGAGYMIGGTGNVVSNNSSGKKTDRGNGAEGYVISGVSVSLQDNAAEANIGSGYVLTSTATTSLFKGNTSTSNLGHGFDIQSGGNKFDTCAADNKNADPGSHAWMLAANNTEAINTNKANGSTIGIPVAGGFCDNNTQCPKNK